MLVNDSHHHHQTRQLTVSYPPAAGATERSNGISWRCMCARKHVSQHVSLCLAWLGPPFRGRAAANRRRMRLRPRVRCRGMPWRIARSRSGRQARSGAPRAISGSLLCIASRGRISFAKLCSLMTRRKANGRRLCICRETVAPRGSLSPRSSATGRFRCPSKLGSYSSCLTKHGRFRSRTSGTHAPTARMSLWMRTAPSMCSARR